MAKPKSARAGGVKPLSFDEILGLLGIAAVLVFIGYVVYRRATASSRKYKQDNPYVATISLQERFLSNI
jgi:hypothetical protein